MSREELARHFLPTVLPASWQERRPIEAGLVYRKKTGLLVIASVDTEGDGKLWMHLSMSHRNKLPRWGELVEVKELFGGDRFAVQVLPPKEEYVNFHPYCLHLWVLLEGERPLPDFRIDGLMV